MHLAKLPLTQLDLSYRQNITDDGLVYLTDLPLTHLRLINCKRITEAGLEHLAKLPLTHLDLHSCNLEDPTRASEFHLIRNYLNQRNLLGIGTLSAENRRLHNLITEYTL